MLRANQNLPMTIMCCVLTFMLCARAASGGNIFFDDFNDGNAQDGTPVTWTPGLGTWDASSGDYVATGPTTPRVSRALAYVLGDVSARAQVRVVGNIAATIGLRRTQPLVGYAGVVRVNGTIGIARVGGAAGPVNLGSAVVPFNVGEQDVLLQFDAFGNKLSLWAWRVDEEMPVEPQLVVFDDTYSAGPVALVSPGFNALPSASTIFRFIQVDNTHITKTFEPPPLVTIRASQVEVCWNSKSNLTYQVQYRSDLTTNLWTSLVGCIRSTNSTSCINDPIIVGQPKRFYRVVLTNCVPSL